MTDLSIVACDAEAKGYTHFTITSLGDTGTGTGSLTGNTGRFLWTLAGTLNY